MALPRRKRLLTTFLGLRPLAGNSGGISPEGVVFDSLFTHVLASEQFSHAHFQKAPAI